MNFKVSIIIPFFNEEKGIAIAINSILNQTYRNVELILIDDHSTDNSKSICLKYNDDRVKYFYKNNLLQGRANSRNYGILMATGDIITFLDADDESNPNRISCQLQSLVNNGLYNVICGCWVQKQGLSVELMKLPISHEEIILGFERQYNRTTIVGATIMGHRSIFEKYKYDEKFTFFEDWDFILRLYDSKEIRFINVDIPLYTYNIHTNGTKFNKEWFDFNLFARDCQIKRRKGKVEFLDIDSFRKNIQSDFKKKILYNIIKILLNIKIKLKQ